MWVLDAKEIKSSFKIDLRDMSWWMFIKDIKDVYKLVVPVIVKLSKERCIFLAVRRKSSCTTHKCD
jgi:hypothetical protein